MNKDLVFIVSGGRTGTQFFGDRLKDIIDDCWSEHEPDMVQGLSILTLNRIIRFGVWHMVIGRVLGRSGIRVVGRRYRSGKINDKQLYKKIRAMREDYHKQHEEHLIVESYYVWWLLVNQIQVVWPNAKIICVIRDPRTWINSWLKHQQGRRSETLKENFLSANVTPELIGDKDWIEPWKDMSQIAKLAWEWKTIYTTLYEASERSELTSVFRFEDVFSNNTFMREVLHFVSHHENRSYNVNESILLTFTSDRINASKKDGSSWESWSDEDARIVEELCGPLMKIYNYGDEPEWLNKIKKA